MDLQQEAVRRFLESSSIYAADRKVKKNITIQTPKGILFQTEILEITRSETEVTCAVRKDGGDDPDITSGTLIFSTVRFADGEKKYRGRITDNFQAFM